MSENKLCQHIQNEEIINELNPEKIKKNDSYKCLCLSCGEIINSLESINNHYKNKNHKIFINFEKSIIICNECNAQYDLKLLKDIKKYKILFQILKEYGIIFSLDSKFLTKEEIYEVKYNKFTNNFKKGKFKKILFMVGAGISTSAGIPDFRSQAGLYKQMQEKYHLSTPEEFFSFSTFLKHPNYFYEQARLTNFKNYNPTITHKFMSFLTKKNIVKYVFSQNVDGLEVKAHIPLDKIIFAHGSFYSGHCAKCKCSIDMEKINKGIETGKVYYCPKCNGPCKPDVVFYGENLPKRFFEKLSDIKDVDLIIIMGTTLKVYPFAGIPSYANKNASIILFNMDKVGPFEYDSLIEDCIFIEGKTDEKVIKFLKDSDLYNEFNEFLKREYNEDNNSIDKAIDGINKIDLNKK